MLFKKYIQSIIAIILIGVFAFSILPQKSVHDFVAKHVDVEKCSVHKNLPIDQVEKKATHCNYDNLVVALPYVNTTIKMEVQKQLSYSIKYIATATTSIPNAFQVIDTRGPPVNA